MPKDPAGISETPRFYQNGIDKWKSGHAAKGSPLFATQLLSAQSLIATARGLGLSDSSFLLENTMVETLNALARQLAGGKEGMATVSGRLDPFPTGSGCRQVDNGSAATENSVSFFGETAAVSSMPLGSLSARFESGRAGIAAIGYDPQGGTSYGRYQISSKAGSMARFLSFLDSQAPEWSARLRSSGPADTGSKEGAMPAEWKALAAEDPDRFETFQHQFIRQEYYLPARDRIVEKTGLDFEKAPRALQEILWSTAVQHGAGGATRIFEKAAERFTAGGLETGDPRELIQRIFSLRSERFGSSPERVQAAVRNRFYHEQKAALAMLDAPSPKTT